MQTTTTTGAYDWAYDYDDDNDGILDSNDPDIDGDGILNEFDNNQDLFDQDGDGIPDSIDTTEKIEILKDPAFLDCKISLYTKTYLRGDVFTLDKENSESNNTLLIKDLSQGNERYTLCKLHTLIL